MVLCPIAAHSRKPRHTGSVERWRSRCVNRVGVKAQGDKKRWSSAQESQLVQASGGFFFVTEIAAEIYPRLRAEE